MSLKAFHVLFITACTLLSVGMAGWGWATWRAQGDRQALVLGVLAAGAAVGLVVYSAWVRRKLGRLVTLALLPLLAVSDAAACPVCFGDPSSPLTKAAAWGVTVLGGIIAGVLAIIAYTAFTWARRARALEAAAAAPTPR